MPGSTWAVTSQHFNFYLEVTSTLPNLSCGPHCLCVVLKTHAQNKSIAFMSTSLFSLSLRLSSSFLSSWLCPLLLLVLLLSLHGTLTLSQNHCIIHKSNLAIHERSPQHEKMKDSLLTWSHPKRVVSSSVMTPCTQISCLHMPWVNGCQQEFHCLLVDDWLDTTWYSAATWGVTQACSQVLGIESPSDDCWMLVSTFMVSGACYGDMFSVQDVQG